MENSTPRRSAHALPNRLCAPQTRKTKGARKPYRPLSDARVRELYQQSQGIQSTPTETALFVRMNRDFIDAIFNGDDDLDTRFPEPEDE